MALVTKAELRRDMRTRLAALGPCREEKSRAIVASLVRHPALTGRPRVAVYSPLPSEPDIEALWELAPSRFCYPRVVEDRMEFVAVDRLEDLAPAPWHPHIREHGSAEARVVAPKEIDVILVPGLAFTRLGLRLGRGGGYYDRYLEGLSAKTLKIGVCFALQLVETLPVELHDQRMNAVVTDAGIFP